MKPAITANWAALFKINLLNTVGYLLFKHPLLFFQVYAARYRYK